MAFDWMKLNGGGTPFVGISYRTRANTEGCLLFTTGRNATPERKPGCLSGGFLIPSNHLMMLFLVMETSLERVGEILRALTCDVSEMLSDLQRPDRPRA
jgi:hypothetical protein